MKKLEDKPETKTSQTQQQKTQIQRPILDTSTENNKAASYDYKYLLGAGAMFIMAYASYALGF